MHSSSVLPSRWTEGLNRMQQTVKHCLAIEIPPRHAELPPPAILPIPLPNNAQFDAVVGQGDACAKEADAILQSAADELFRWQLAYQRTAQQLADHLRHKVE
jgi:hypothetical protein